MLKNDTLKNGTSRIGLYGSAPPGVLHVAVSGCNLQWFQKMLESLRKIEPSFTLCNHCQPKTFARKVAERSCYTLQPTFDLSRNASATSCNTII